MHETWLPIVGYEGLYEISNRGRVKSLAKIDRLGRHRPEIIMKQKLCGKQPSPSFAVGLRKDGITRNRYVHILMLEAFIGPRPPGLVGCHKDDTPRNELSNLKWDTVSGNNFDLVRNGNHARARRTHCKRAGHPLTPDNVYINPTNKARSCRKCMRLSAQSKQREIEQNRPERFCSCGQPIKSLRALRCTPCKKKHDSQRVLTWYHNHKSKVGATQ